MARASGKGGCGRLAKRLPLHTACLPVQKCGHNDYLTPQLITHIVIVTTITVSATVTTTVTTMVVIVSIGIITRLHSHPYLCLLKMFDPTALEAVSFCCIRTSSHQLNTPEACRRLFFGGPHGDRRALPLDSYSLAIQSQCSRSIRSLESRLERFRRHRHPGFIVIVTLVVVMISIGIFISVVILMPLDTHLLYKAKVARAFDLLNTKHA